LAVPRDGCQKVVEVVRDAPGELADGLHLLGLDQLLLEAPLFLLALLALGDVVHETLEVACRAVRVADGSRVQLDPDRRPVPSLPADLLPRRLSLRLVALDQPLPLARDEIDLL